LQESPAPGHFATGHLKGKDVHFEVFMLQEFLGTNSFYKTIEHGFSTHFVSSRYRFETAEKIRRFVAGCAIALANTCKWMATCYSLRSVQKEK
jgi:hypothetical protein